jgi:hypothetical protein
MMTEMNNENNLAQINTEKKDNVRRGRGGVDRLVTEKEQGNY